MSDIIGRVFSRRYRVEKKIGAGGMSVVYLAEDILLHRPVAVKILREQYSDDEQNIRFFQNEARSIAALSHPNIVKIYDIGKEDNHYFIVMEYLDGRTLKQIIREKAPMRPQEAIDFIRMVLRALEHSHHKGIIHRDVKPHNIILDRDSKVKVTDFGIARNAGASTVTYSGHMVGSVYYISPEQAGGGRTTRASDLYSTGAMLFEMLTGSVPYSGDNPVGVALAHIHQPVPSVRARNRSVPECLDDIVQTAMAKDPQDRYESAADMIRALTEAKDLIASGKSRKKKNRKVRKIAWGAAIVLGAGLLIMAGLRLLQPLRPVEVPAVVGLQDEAAQAKLEQAGFASDVTRRVETDDFAPGTVMNQDPEAGLEVRTSRTILLTLAKEPQEIEVPDLSGMTERKARLAIENLGLTPLIRQEYAMDERQAKGTVFRQEPTAGSGLREGEPVTVWINLGEEPGRVTMSNLKGLSFAEAERWLQDNGLVLGEISYDDSNLYFLGKVMGQSAPAGSVLSASSEVSLVISRGPGLAPATKEITFKLPGLKESLVTVWVEDQSGGHEEYRDTHIGGEPLRIQVEHLGEGTATVYQDEQAIMTVDLP